MTDEYSTGVPESGADAATVPDFGPVLDLDFDAARQTFPDWAWMGPTRSDRSPFYTAEQLAGDRWTGAGVGGDRLRAPDLPLLVAKVIAVERVTREYQSKDGGQ